MEEDYKSLFQSIPTPPLPENLSGRVFRTIDVERARLYQRRMIFRVAYLGLSFLGFVASALNLGISMRAGEFGRYASLLISDFGVISAYWQSFLMLMLESLPVSQIVYVLFAIFILLLAVRGIVLPRNKINWNILNHGY